MQRKRLTLLMAAALFQGASIGPLIDLAIQVDPRYAFIVFVVCWCIGIFGFFVAKFDNVVIESHQGFLYSCSIYNSYVYYVKLLIVLWSHALRQANQVTDGLAEFGLYLDRSNRMLYSILRFISSAVYVDLSVVPVRLWFLVFFVLVFSPLFSCPPKNC